jgi:hypothetical protein
VRAVAMTLSLLIATAAIADEAAPRVRRKPDLRYVVSGAVLLGVFYALPLALAIRFEEGELAVPLLGPLVDLRRCSGCTANSVEQGVVAGLVLDTVLQAAGASLLILGLIRRKPTRLSVAPTPSGFVVGGRF